MGSYSSCEVQRPQGTTPHAGRCYLPPPLDHLTAVKSLFTTLAFGAASISIASAADINVSANIASSATWTADNVYSLQGQIFVLPGATLTIEAGTVIASVDGGSLAVSRGAQIFANGQSGAPIIFTSDDDRSTWAGNDPKTGTWRASANEWGNLTLMGAGFISENGIPTNSATPSASNFADMEGLTPPAGTTIGQYGGGNDDDDSGVISYVSFRYGGRVVGLNNELNGLSLGGIGRGTDIHHIEIMNNVDDGIEIWGGTVNLKYFSIWNIGDDSLDIDQGWRGKAQFGLIVQGYSLNAPQGSGVGDNAIEMDGAEDSFWQPVTTSTIYNMTVIGQPFSGDGLTAWRDGARVQFRNSIFMDGGERVVRADGDDGDGASGYGAMGSLSFADVWNTPYTSTSPINAPGNPAAFYTVQSSGNLTEIVGSVFYRNLNSSAYTEANARGVFAPGNDNVLISSTSPAAAPIVSIIRSAPVTLNGNLQQLQVIGLDPKPTNQALNSVSLAPGDSFFSRANYRGAFSPNTENNWLCGWTASDAFGFTGGNCVGTQFCESNPNQTGVRGQITAYGSASAAVNNLTLEASDLPPNQFGIFFTSATPGNSPIGNGVLCVSPVGIGRYGSILNTGAPGVVSLSINLNTIPAGTGVVAAVAGETRYFQFWHREAVGSNVSNGLAVTFE